MRYPSIGFFRLHCWCSMVILLLLACPSIGFASTDAMNDDVKALMGVPFYMEPDFQRLVTRPDKEYTEAEALTHEPNLLSLEVAHIGAQRVLFRAQFAHPPGFDRAGARFHFYLDMDNNRDTGRQDDPSHRGVDVMIVLADGTVRPSSHSPEYSPGRIFAGGATIDNMLYLVLEAPLHGDADTIRFSLHAAASRHAGGKRIGQESIPRLEVALPRQTGPDLPLLDRSRLTSLVPLTAFRYIDSRVKYETLENKGLLYQTVVGNAISPFGRERPSVPFVSQTPAPHQPGTIAKRRVQIDVLEEVGARRAEAAITFGFPLPRGAVYDLQHFRLLAPSGDEVSAQYTATSFWPDNSLKWVLVSFTDNLNPHERRIYSLEFGNEIRRTVRTEGDHIIIRDSDTAITITTGPYKPKSTSVPSNCLIRFGSTPMATGHSPKKSA
jgi:hypothetical protein